MVLGKRMPQGSYYDKNYRPTPSLYRARQPYLVKNALTGVAIFAFVSVIYSYTIRAVGQDDFSDVPMPDSTVQTGATVGNTPSPITR